MGLYSLPASQAANSLGLVLTGRLLALVRHQSLTHAEHGTGAQRLSTPWPPVLGSGSARPLGVPSPGRRAFPPGLPLRPARAA